MAKVFRLFQDKNLQHWEDRGEAFGPSGYLRFSYATSDEDIVEGIGRIKKLLTEG